ncbi:MAG: ComEC/Rec2 family competence protein, partial [candidate division WOR-3 bacterium]
ILIVLFFSAGVYQTSRALTAGKRIYFRGIYLNNRIIDPIYGEVYAELPTNCGDLAKGSGEIIKKGGISRLVNIEATWSSPTILNKLFSLRNSLDKKILEQCPDDVGKISSAITLGLRKTLPPYMYKRFQSCGAAHLLAVSGLHTGIISVVIFLFMRTLQLKRKPALLISGIFVLIYAVFTGIRLPVLRASVMLFFFVIGETRERNIDPVNTLCSAGIFITLLMPRSVLSVSFQLSFLAVLSILVMFNMLKEYFGKIPDRWYKHWIIIPFFITLSAQLGTLPLVAYHFGYIPLLGLFANLILIPLTGALISGCFFFFLFPFLGKLSGNFIWATGFTMNKLMATIEKTPFVIIKTTKNNSLFFFLYPIFIISVLLWTYNKTKEKDVVDRLRDQNNF